MKSKITLTKSDLIVVLVCLIFLLANIASVGKSGMVRAKETLCLSNLQKWGEVFQSYTADNDGYFNARRIGTDYDKLWYLVYKPYYQDPMMRFCPTADDPSVKIGTFGTWFTGGFGSWDPEDYPIPGEGDDQTGIHAPTGSYGMNRYIENLQGGSVSTNPSFWRRAGLKGADKAPVLMDCMYVYYWADPYAEPPAYEGDYTQNEMKWICLNRHTGYVNSVFLDFSARKVGLKELWTLKHSRTYNTCGAWTICGFSGNVSLCAAYWDEVAPWMSDFPEY